MSNVVSAVAQAGPVSSNSMPNIVEVSNLVVKYGNVTAVDGVSFCLKAGEFLTLLGPSGCGKTTLLRAIAGLERPSSGEIRIDGTVVYSSKQGIDVPSEKRNLSMVFQSYAIWPHMSAFENVVYGLRVRKRPRDEIQRQGEWALGLVRMQQYGERPASALSGGQQQRLALARAVAFSPKVILFDEPLSNLDANLRVQMRREIKTLQRAVGVSSLYVTHDQEEALTMSDRIIVMSGGKVQQESAPEQLYNYPVNKFVAEFIGSANLLPGRIDESARDRETVDFVLDGGLRIRAHDGRANTTNTSTLLAIRAVYPQLSPTGLPSAHVNIWPCTILDAIFSGDFIEYTVDASIGRIVVRRPPSDRYAVSSSMTLSIDPKHCVVVEA